MKYLSKRALQKQSESIVSDKVVVCLSKLKDVSIGSPRTGDFLVFENGRWISKSVEIKTGFSGSVYVGDVAYNPDANGNINLPKYPDLDSFSDDIDKRIQEAKSEILGGAGQDYDTLKEIEYWIEEHQDLYKALVSTVGEKATLEYVNEKLSEKLDASALDGYVSEKYVQDELDKIKQSIPSLTGYATQQWVTDQGFLKEHQSLDNYYTKSQTDNAIREALNSVGSGNGTVNSVTVGSAKYSPDGDGNVTLPAYPTVPTSWAWSAITGRPTTIGGYGITDAKIANGVITIGENSITPLTSHQSLTNYVTLNTNQKITAAKFFVGSAIRVQMDRDTSQAVRGLCFVSTSDTDIIAELMYHNTAQRLFLNPNGSADVYSDAKGKYSLKIGVDELTYNTYPILRSDNFSSYLDGSYVKKSGDTMSGALTLPISTNFYTKPGLVFNAAAQIAATSSGNVGVYSLGYIALRPQISSLSESAGGLGVTVYSDSLNPAANNSISLGTSSYRWSNVYSVLGNFSGQITSTVATGTAPFSVASTTAVANLNADLLDGYHVASFPDRGYTSVKLENQTTARWVRIATCSTYSSSGIISLVKSYSYGITSPVVFYFSCSYRASGRMSLVQLGGVNEDFSKARIVYPTASNDNYYIEVYYVRTSSSAGSNTAYIRGSSLLNTTLSNAYEDGTVPSGYSSYEVDFVSKGISAENVMVSGLFEVSNSYGGVEVKSNSSGARGVSANNESGSDLGWLVATNGTNSWLGIGRVGIGTQAPEKALHVKGDGVMIENGTSACYLYMGRNSANYIKATDAAGYLCFVPNGIDATKAASTLVLENKNAYPGTTNVGTLGLSGNRWSNVYSVLGNFSGAVTGKTFVCSSTSGEAHMTFSRGGVNYIYAPASGSIAFVTNGNTVGTAGIAMCVTSASNVVIGAATSTSYKLDVRGAIYSTEGFTTPKDIQCGNIQCSNFTVQGIKCPINLTEGTVISGKTYLGITYDGDLYFMSNSSSNKQPGGSSLLIASNKYVAIGGSTTPSYPLHVIGAVGATVFNNTSDARLKNIKRHIDIDVEDIANAPYIEFTWKKTGETGIGSIAQYWESIVPEAISTDNDGYKYMQYGPLALIAAGSVAKRIVSLENRIKELEKKLESYTT